MINISNLNKKFKKNGLTVINNTSLSLPDKGLITLLGESGSGKTTLLNVIGGLDSFDSGSIEYDGYNTAKYNMKNMDKFRNSNISYIFQNYYLINDLSVYDNLKLALEIIDIIDKDEVDKRIKIALEAVKLWKFRKKKVDTLSGGQQQRVCIARALVKPNKLIIADEPTGNLDSENSINIMNILKEISKNNLVLLVTHNKSLANYYSDYIYNLKDGTIIDGYVPEKGSLNVEDNVIYLKDLEKENNVINNNEFNIYNKKENIKLDIICIDGQYYIRSDKPIKLIDQSNLKVLDASKNDLVEKEEKIIYDSSSFENIYDKNKFKRIIKQIKSSNKNYKSSKFKTKIFRFGLVVMGAMFAALAISFIKYSTPDLSSVIYNQNEYIVDRSVTEGNRMFNHQLEELYCKGDIICAGTGQNNVYFQAKYKLDFDDYSEISSNSEKVRIIKYGFNSNKIIYGSDNFSSKSDIIISKKIAEKIHLNLSLNNLIGKYISNQNDRYRIIGITDADDYCAYISNYDILEYNSDYLNPDVLSIVQHKYMTARIFKTNEMIEKYLKSRNFVIEGSYPKNKNEILISENVDKTLYEKHGLKVVGTYTATNEIYLNVLLSEDAYKIFQDMNDFYDLRDISGITFRFKDNNMAKKYSNVKLANDFYTEQQYISIYETNKVLLICTGVLIVILFVYIYFTQHAKLMSNIKEVGMLRAIGASKLRVSSKYGCDSFVEALHTITIGYAAISIITMIIDSITSSLYRYSEPPVYIYSSYVLYVGLIVTYILFFIFGMIPSLLLTRKTPSEIIAKYDI